MTTRSRLSCIIIRFSIGIFILLAFTVISYAGELYSPPLTSRSLSGDNFTECAINNVGTVPRDVQIQGFNSEGVVVADHTFNVAPYHTRGFSLSESPASVMFCKFSFKGRRDNFRAAIHVLDGNGEGIISALEAH